MSKIQFDIVEVLLKSELGIPLSDSEKIWFKHIDEDIKKAAILSINAPSYGEELLIILNRILDNIELIPVEYHEHVKAKCYKKIYDINNSIKEEKKLSEKNVEKTIKLSYNQF